MEVDDVRNTIAGALDWALCAVLLWLLIRALPATGMHRKSQRPKHRATSNRSPLTSGNQNDPARPAVRIPSPRSPYSQDRAPLDGGESPLSRPYLPRLADTAPEVASQPGAARVRPYWTDRSRAVQRRRRRVLWLATVGVDIDTRNIHAHNVGAVTVGGVR